MTVITQSNGLGDQRPQPQRRHPVRYIGAYSECAFILESVQFIWRAICAAQSESPYSTILIGLSGGSTPRKILKTLASLSSNQSGEFCMRRPSSKTVSDAKSTDESEDSNEYGKLDWTRVAIFLVDERYVPSNHPESNQKMLRDTLLSEAGVNIREENLIFPDTSKPLDKCIANYDFKLRKGLATCGRPYLVILGMGDDGHTGSWFPPMSPEEYMSSHSPHQVVFHTEQDRFAVHDRITVSMELICSSIEKLFLLSGESKVNKWKHLIALDSDEDLVEQPVLQVLQSFGITTISNPPLISDVLADIRKQEEEHHLSVIVFGASGDLAKKKTIPALFSLFCEGLLPDNFHIIGYARTEMTHQEFWKKMEPNLLKLDSFFRGSRRFTRALMRDTDLGFLENFKKRLIYVSGNYDKIQDFQSLNERLQTFESVGDKRLRGDRLFYLALPPNVFESAIKTARDTCWSSGWNRVVVEKPFGRDYDSAMKLASNLLQVLEEAETFRIDHYLGKEMVLNLIAIRFANATFAPLMSWQHVSAVRVTFKEDIGTKGRGGYFDQYGIIRDIMQNHLLQIMTIVAMERPASLKDDDVRDEKVKVLKQILPIQLNDVVVGQYTRSSDGKHEGYLDDKTVPSGSLCPTFCTAVMHIQNERWAGVPFILKAGKALEKRETEIRIQFRSVAGNLFGSDVPQNELVVKIQPSEAIYMKVLTKKPGLATGLQQTELDLTVMDRFDIDRLPDAYERLLLDVVKGDKQNFVRTDELREAWRIFTPLLHELESKKIKPLLYEFGSTGPKESYDLIKRVGYVRYEGYSWNPFNDNKK